jgi:FKBP-type peptidyl-prolyl cis-trans isomerase SlpA
MFMSLVEPGSFRTLHYRLAGPEGDVINTFGGKPATLSLGTGELAPAVEARLIGLPEGARASFDLAPGEAFGQRNPDMIQWLARAALDSLGDPDERYQVGDVVHLPTLDGRGQFAGVVQAVRGDGALRLDFNHPLAGRPVRFEVQVIGVL